MRRGLVDRYEPPHDRACSDIAAVPTMLPARSMAMSSISATPPSEFRQVNWPTVAKSPATGLEPVQRQLAVGIDLADARIQIGRAECVERRRPVGRGNGAQVDAGRAAAPPSSGVIAAVRAQASARQAAATQPPRPNRCHRADTAGSIAPDSPPDNRPAIDISLSFEHVCIY